MIKDIPYSVLKQNARAYEIMLLRDQHANTFTDMAKEFNISAERVKNLYYRMKIRQIRLYIHHISAALGHENTSQIKKIYNNAYECYQNWQYACAYLEKKYNVILSAYREGEPGMPAPFINAMPPFKPKLSQKTIARIIEMREVEKASYTAIAKELRMTRDKARDAYESFYHKQVLRLIDALQAKAESHEERKAIFDYYFGKYATSKKRYDALMDTDCPLRQAYIVN